jgi:hypothetical protein
MLVHWNSARRHSAAEDPRFLHTQSRNFMDKGFVLAMGWTTWDMDFDSLKRQDFFQMGLWAHPTSYMMST